MKKILIAGYGSCGSYLVDFILKDHRISDDIEIHIMSRKSLDEVNPRLEISRVAAGISDRYIDLVYHQCDFNDIPGMTKLLSDISPKIIVYTGRYASGLKYGSFSYPRGIGYGVWMPLSIIYIRNLMIAVNASGIRTMTKVINTSFPDGVNPMLWRNGYNVFCGAGNLNHLIPRIKRSLVKLYGLTLKDYSVHLIGSHYLNTYVSKEGDPKDCNFGLRVYQKGFIKDLSQNEVFEILRNSKDNSASGHIRNQMIATDCAELVRILLNPKEGEIFHVPGFKGRLGGEPIYFTNRNEFDHNPEEVFYPLYKEELVTEINSDGLRRDGVIITDQGNLRFTDEARKMMKDEFDLSYPEEVSLNDIDELANTIRNKLEEISK